MSKKSLFLVLQRKAADDNKDNYVLVKDKLHSFSVIPTTYEDKKYERLMAYKERELNVDTQDSIKLV